MKENKYTRKFIADKLREIYDTAQGSRISESSNLDNVLAEIKDLVKLVRNEERFFRQRKVLTRATH